VRPLTAVPRRERPYSMGGIPRLRIHRLDLVVSPLLSLKSIMLPFAHIPVKSKQLSYAVCKQLK
jgi:hypothetical protein